MSGDMTATNQTEREHEHERRERQTEEHSLCARAGPSGGRSGTTLRAHSIVQRSIDSQGECKRAIDGRRRAPEAAKSLAPHPMNERREVPVFARKLRASRCVSERR